MSDPTDIDRQLQEWVAENDPKIVRARIRAMQESGTYGRTEFTPENPVDQSDEIPGFLWREKAIPGFTLFDRIGRFFCCCRVALRDIWRARKSPEFGFRLMRHLWYLARHGGL